MGWNNILVITVGESPPVVTETVWALFNRHGGGKPDPFIPQQIHLVTTERGRMRFGAELVGPGKKLEQLFRAFGHPAPVVEVNLPVAVTGAELGDIRTEAENIAYANTVSRLIKRYADDTNTRVHVSLAGGRKTMSYYAAAAISLFGRDQDELSHVLVVPEQLEQCEGFWWPGQPEPTVAHRTEKNANGAPVTYNTDPTRARVELALIPFVRLKRLLTEDAFPGGDVQYENVVAAVQDNLDTQNITIICDDRLLVAGPYSIKLPHLQFALYHLVAAAKKFDWPGAGPMGLGPGEKGWISYDQLLDPDGDVLKRFGEYYDAAFHIGSQRHREFMEVVRHKIAAAQDKGTADPIAAAQMLDEARRRFVQAMSKLNKLLTEQIDNPAIRRRVQVSTEGRDPARFGLLLEAQQVEVK
jgi:CRISPR-associated protein (TIGR02584 family)